MRPYLCLLAFAVACSDSPTGSSSALLSQVNLSKELITPGDSVVVHITLTNPTSRVIEVSGATPCFITFTVQATGGPELAADPRACPAVIDNVRLRAGERRDVSIIWNLTVGGTPLPLGEYRVRGGLQLANKVGLQVPSRPKHLQIVVFGH